jgi:hypothetical protein
MALFLRGKVYIQPRHDVWFAISGISGYWRCA